MFWVAAGPVNGGYLTAGVNCHQGMMSFRLSYSDLYRCIFYVHVLNLVFAVCVTFYAYFYFYVIFFTCVYLVYDIMKKL